MRVSVRITYMNIMRHCIQDYTVFATKKEFAISKKNPPSGAPTFSEAESRAHNAFLENIGNPKIVHSTFIAEPRVSLEVQFFVMASILDDTFTAKK